MSVLSLEMSYLYWFFDCPFFEAFENMRMACVCQTQSSPNAHECFLGSLKIDAFSKTELKIAARHLFPQCTELLNSKIGMEFCQQLLDRCDEETRRLVLEDVDVCEVIQDEEGCDLIQRICQEYGDDSQAVVFNKVREKLPSLCIHKWGSAPVRTLLSKLKMPDVFEAFELVTNDVHMLIKHENGTRCLETLLGRAIDAGDPEYLCQYTALPMLVSNLLESLGASIWTNSRWTDVVLSLLPFIRGETANKFVQVVAPNLLECWMTRGGCRIINAVLEHGTTTCRRGIIDGILALHGEQLREFLRARASYVALQKALQVNHRHVELSRLLPKQSV